MVIVVTVTCKSDLVRFAAMMVSSSGAAAVSPALILFLLVISSSVPSVSAQRFDLSQLSLRAAAEAQAGSSGYFNCPEQVWGVGD